MKRMFMCMNIAGFMRNERFPGGYEGVFQTDEGVPLNAREAHDYLISELAKGRKVIPTSAQCGSPCQHAGKGCAGFDYGGGGCPGFDIPDTSTTETAT